MFFTGKFILDLAQFVEGQGMDKSKIYNAAGFSEKKLMQQDFFVDYDCISEVFMTIKNEIGPPCFGLHMGEQINLMATRYVDRLMDSCSNVQEAFEHAIAYSKLISDSMKCTLEIFDNHFQVNFELNPNWAIRDDYAIIQNLDLALICAKNSLFRLTNREFYPSEVNLYYPKPKRLSEHYRLFNCHLRFNRPVSSIVFNRHILEKPILNNKQGLLEQLKEVANKVLASLPDESPLILNVKKSILKNITPTSFHMSHVAKDLNMTPRTLQRRLKAENTTFKQVQNQMRLVKKFMGQGFDSLDEIAYLVGYSESSALVRGFKSWTGQSPGKYLESMRIKKNKPGITQ